MRDLRQNILKDFPFVDVEADTRKNSLTVRVFSKRVHRNLYVLHSVLKDFNDTVSAIWV